MSRTYDQQAYAYLKTNVAFQEVALKRFIGLLCVCLICWLSSTCSEEDLTVTADVSHLQYCVIFYYFFSQQEPYEK